MTTTATDLKQNLSLPLIVAPMFLVSTPDMALACCKEGLVGSFPALNQRTSEGLEQWLKQMNDGIERLKKENPDSLIAPYAVNLFVNAKMNPRLEEDLALCIKYKVPVIITSLGAATDVIDKIHAYGGIVLHDVTNVEHAKKAVAAGVDGLIAVTGKAGGHAGTLDAATLVSQIRQFFSGPLVLAGGLTSGNDIFDAEQLGADFAYMGTRFIATTDCAAPQAYKDMLVAATAADIIYTAAISGVPANFLRQSLEAAGIDVDALLKNAGDQKHAIKSLESEAKAWKNVWSAGHGVSAINDIPSIATLAGRLRQEYHAAASKKPAAPSTTPDEPRITPPASPTTP